MRCIEIIKKKVVEKFCNDRSWNFKEGDLVLTKSSRFENVIGFKFQIKRFRARVFEYSLRLSELSWHLLLGTSSLLLTAWEGRALDGETEMMMIQTKKLIWLKHQHLKLANWLKMMASPCVWDILIVIDSLGLRLWRSSGRFRLMRAR